MERLKSPKTIALLLVVALAAVVFLQNRQPVTLKVLGIAKVDTTLAIALICACLLGAVVGALVFGRWMTRQHGRREPGAPDQG